MAVDQPSLFTANVRPSDPSTSHAAARARRVTLRSRVEEQLRLRPGGLTDWELCSSLGLPERRKPSVAKRRQEVGAVDSGRRRRSPDGHDCIVWRV